MFLAEMALTLKPHRTGLPFEIWVSEKSYAEIRHRPRLKVYDKGYNSSVSVDNPVEVLAGHKITGRKWNRLVEYIKINRELLLDLWDEKIDQVDYSNNHVPLS